MNESTNNQFNQCAVIIGLARDAHASVIDAMVQEALNKAGMQSAAEVGMYVMWYK